MVNEDFYHLLLNLMLFVPLLGIAVLLALPKASAKYVALVFSLVSFVLSLVVFKGYLAVSGQQLSAQDGGYVFYRAFEMAQGTFLEGYDIKYILGIDGISIYLILLTTLLFPLSIWFSFSSVHKMDKGYYALLLLLMTSVMGVFMSLDLVLFYIFFELGLIPMYFLIGIWGGKDRIYAALKFFLYTLAGSVLLLLAVIYLGLKVGPHVSPDLLFTSDLSTLMHYLFDPGSPAALSWNEQYWLFLGFAISFAIKVPVFPVHTWLPDAHVQAPTAGSVILAGVLLQRGTYGLIRCCLSLL
ncbi:MAG: NuoM family protein, partial [Sphingobacteriia bacterium]